MTMRISIFFTAFIILLSCQDNSSVLSAQSKKTDSKIDKIEKTDAEWKKDLTDLEYHVLREEGTERAFSGDLWDHKGDGVYTCAACALPLFDSKTKYKSGTGWPSYYQPINDTNVGESTDYKIGYARTEVHCARCDGHLGHVFKDGPKPTGLRYCINSVSLDFIDRKDHNKSK